MPKSLKPKRFVFRISITPESKDVLEGISGSIGITQIALCSKLILWLADQPDEIKHGILGGFPALLEGDPVDVKILKRIIVGLN